MFSRTWLLLIPLLLWTAARAQETSMAPVSVDGQTVRLEMRIYKPATAGPVPTLVFNHGSTGRGRDPSLFTRPMSLVDVNTLARASGSPLLPGLFLSFVDHPERGW
jgi:hypothetical protein